MAEKYDLSSKPVVAGLPTDANRLFPDRAQDGLYLRCQDGVKTWAIRLRVSGRQVQKSLPLTQPYKAAVILARELRLEGARGRDVIGERKAEALALQKTLQEAHARRGRSLGKLIEQYLAAAEAGTLPGGKRPLAPRTIVEIRRTLLTTWEPLHDREAASINSDTIAAELERIRVKRGPVAANRAKAYLSSALSYGQRIRWLVRNVSMDVPRPAHEQSRERVLTEPELVAVWNAADPATDFGCIVRTLLLTGARRAEVGGLAWSELDLSRAVWSLPAVRSKNGRPHEVPLSWQVVQLLEGRKRTEGRAAVFGRTTYGSGFVGFGPAKAALDAKLAFKEAWTIHDLRRTFVTGMCELGVAPHIVEAVVNHTSGHKGGVAGVYNKAQYSQEKRAGLQRWADHIERIVNGETATNVVSTIS